MIEISHLGHSLRLKEHRTILAYQMGFLVVCYLCPKTPILANGWWNATLLLLLLLQLPEHEAASEGFFFCFFVFPKSVSKARWWCFSPSEKKTNIYGCMARGKKRQRRSTLAQKVPKEALPCMCSPWTLSQIQSVWERDMAILLLLLPLQWHCSRGPPPTPILFTLTSYHPQILFYFPPLLWTWWPLGTVLVRGRLGVAPLRLRTNSPPKQSVNPKNNFVLNTSLQPQNNIPHALLRWQKEKQKKSEQPH